MKDKKMNELLDDFNTDGEKDEKKYVINSRRDLVEKLDKTLIIEDGRQLRREHH